MRFCDGCGKPQPPSTAARAEPPVGQAQPSQRVTAPSPPSVETLVETHGLSRPWNFADLLICTFIGVLPLLNVLVNVGLPASWDFGPHTFASAKLALWLSHGIYPLELPDIWFGYSLSTFYPPAYYLAVAATSVVSGMDIYNATKVILTISFVGGAIGAYLAARLALEDRPPALVAAVGYTFAGYHISNLIAQGVYPSSLVYMSLPWILAFWYLSLKQGKAAYLVGGAVFLCISVLSHLITGLLTVAILAAAAVVLSVIDLATGALRKGLMSLFSTGAMIAMAFGLSAWFYVPMLKFLPQSYLSTGLIGARQDLPFPLEPYTFIRRNMPVEEILIRLPIDFTKGAQLPFYMGTILIALAVAGLAASIRHVSRSFSNRPVRIGLLGYFLGFNVLVFLFSLLFSTHAELFVLPLWSINHNWAIDLMRMQNPWRALFFMPLSASMLAGYVVRVLFHSKVAAGLRRISKRINLSVDLTKIVAVLLIVLMVLDTYAYASSPFDYNASYPPYNSQGLDSAYRWLVSQPGEFRVEDPFGVHNHVEIWDTLQFPGGWSYSPEYYQYTPNNFRALNITNPSKQWNLTGFLSAQLPEFGYFGVKYAVGHLSDPARDGAGFAGTGWIPVKQFNEIYIFQNPFFRPIAEVVDNPDSINSATVGNATIDSYQPNYMRITLTAVQEPSFLVFKFFKQSQWRAYVDGELADPLENQWGFMYLKIGPQTKEVVFAFGHLYGDPMGTTISVTTIILISVALLISFRRRKRQSIRQSHQKEIIEEPFAEQPQPKDA